MTPLTVFTVGHSTRTIEEFVHLLKAHAIQHVIDVRSMPRSRHNPQFAQDQLSSALERFRIHYSHMSGLGGRRHARRDSTNTGWRNVSFRGFADHMQSQEFESGVAELIKLAESKGPVVIMCAEALPWRCHRSLIADALLVRGVEVGEVTSAMHVRPYSLTSWARISGMDVTYPSAGFGTDEITSARMGNGRPVKEKHA